MCMLLIIRTRNDHCISQDGTPVTPKKSHLNFSQHNTKIPYNINHSIIQFYKIYFIKRNANYTVTCCGIQT